MAKRPPSRTSSARRGRGEEVEGYWEQARRPLQMLIFLLPLILAYEAGLAWILRSDQGVITNRAHESLLAFFDILGVPAAGGLWLGGIVIMVVLLVWHLLERGPWRVDGPTAGFMAIESLLLTLPLIALGLLVQRGLAAAGVSPVEVELSRLDLASRAAISVGAGLYEELLFRMLLIAIIHTLLVDLAGVSHTIGVITAVVISAAAFTWYHPLHDADGTLAASRLVFYFLAGLYFGAIYVGRGFGIVVAVHAMYDVLTVVVMRG